MGWQQYAHQSVDAGAVANPVILKYSEMYEAVSGVC
jgi:hypothetical protein